MSVPLPARRDLTIGVVVGIPVTTPRLVLREPRRDASTIVRRSTASGLSGHAAPGLDQGERGAPATGLLYLRLAFGAEPRQLGFVHEGEQASLEQISQRTRR